MVRKLLLFFLVVLVLANILLVVTGKGWMYKAVYITYLKGYDSSYIDDFVHFPSNEIAAGKHQEWKIAKDYNLKALPKKLIDLNSDLETVAFLVIKNDSIKSEYYWQGYSSDTMSNSFSMAKSYIGALIGVAKKEGVIKSLDQSVCDFIPEFCENNKEQITIKHLLNMQSGLDWDESYHNPLSQMATAYYGKSLKKLIVNLDLASVPGKKFEYHSSSTQILGYILEKATGMSVNEYASEKLWKPIGSKHAALWSTDKKNGDEKTFCCINSNARDFARLGKLYMQKGRWDDAQLIDSNYVVESVYLENLAPYSYHFWITERKGNHVFYARGLWGQYVISIPEKDMIIVRLGKNYGKILENKHRDDLYVYIDAALEMYP